MSEDEEKKPKSTLTAAMKATVTASKPIINYELPPPPLYSSSLPEVKELNYNYLINIVNDTITTAREQIESIVGEQIKQIERERLKQIERERLKQIEREQLLFCNTVLNYVDNFFNNLTKDRYDSVLFDENLADIKNIDVNLHFFVATLMYIIKKEISENIKPDRDINMCRNENTMKNCVRTYKLEDIVEHKNIQVFEKFMKALLYASGKEGLRMLILNDTTVSRKSGGRRKTRRNKKSNRKTKKKQFLYHPNDPKKSFDVYIDKNPKDTIPIKYTTIEDVKNTIHNLEDLYKKGKYSHKRIWQVGMIQKVRLEAMLKNKNKLYPHAKNVKKRFDLANKYFLFLKSRSKETDETKRKKMTFK